MKAVFLDRDGTINLDRGYIYKKEDFVFLPGAVEGMKKLADAGYSLFILTNQSGIARGYYTEDDFHLLNDWMLDELRQNGVIIQKIYYCPHLVDASIEKYKKKCTCRKPGTGMFEEAFGDYDLKPDECWAVGDRMRDCSICLSTGCRGVLIGTTEKETVIEEVKNNKYPNIFYSRDLLSAAEYIVGSKEI